MMTRQSTSFFSSNKMAKKIQTQSISINGTNINKREGI